MPRLLWECWAILGEPVVPLVKYMAAGSRLPVSTGPCSAEAHLEGRDADVADAAAPSAPASRSHQHPLGPEDRPWLRA